MEHHLNIVAFDIPFPANYGGAIDVYYRLKALSNMGVKIIFHCFDYWREPSKEVEDLCEQVYYYHRNTSFWQMFNRKPYTVIGRMNPQLLNNLLSNNYPILFEGLVSCGFINHNALKGRKIFFRECNIEHHYFKALGQASKKMWRKIYYALEYRKLERYEQVLSNADKILALSHTDEAYFKKSFPNSKVYFIPCFHANEQVTSTPSDNDNRYILYHGNLMLEENELAATYMIKEVFSHLNHRCIIAGMNPSHTLEHLVKKYRNIELIANPDELQMETLIHNAHVTLLVTFQATGMKLKLLNTLFDGRYLVANSPMLNGSGLESLCRIADDADAQIRQIQELMHIDFTEADIEMRKAVLSPQYTNHDQAQRLVQIFFE